MKWSFLATVFGLCSVVWASNLPTSKSQYCFYSIYKSLTSFTFEEGTTSSSQTSSKSNGTTISSHTSSKSNGTSTSAGPGASMARRGGRGGGASTTTKYEPYCEDIIEVTSIYASMKEYCSAKEIVKGVAYWQVLCGKNKVDLINLTAIDTELTPQYLASLPVVAPDTYNTSVTVTSPVVLEKSYYKRYLRRLEATIDATPTNIVYGWALIGYWGGVMVLGSLFNLLRASPWSFPQGPGFLATLRYYLRLHLVIPATIGTYYQRALYWCNIPKRLDSLIVFGFWAISIVLSCVNLGTFSGNPTTPDVSQQNWVYLSDRTAVLSYACLCWLWMFGGRNNIFLWSTGWSYGTFSVFHRHIALVATLEAVVHSIGYTVQWNVYSSDYIPALKDLYFVLGIVATIIMCLMIVFAILPIRQRFYELFLLIHIAFAIVLLYCFHTAQVGAVYYSGYLWPPVAIWSFDRFLRLVRLVWCNVRVWYGHASRTQAVVHYSPTSDVMRVDIQNATVQGGPGQYFHLYQPMTLKGWENHPFTLGAFSTGTNASTPLATPGQVEDGLKPSTPQVQATETSSASPSTSTLTFWIRPYDGWTKRLRDQCMQQPGNTISPALLLEGPYGHRAPLHTYHTLIMIMGGTGIACAIPYLQDHLARRRRRATTATVQVQLHWTVRQPAFVMELLQRELADILASGEVQASFYCSCKGALEDEPVPTLDSAKEKGVFTGEKPLQNSAVTIHPGRAPIDQIIAEAGAVAAAESTRVAVVSCGPAAMADQTRAAVHAALKQGCRSVDYFEEAYGW